MFDNIPEHLLMGPNTFPFEHIMFSEEADPAAQAEALSTAICSDEEPVSQVWQGALARRSTEVIQARLRNQLETLLATDVALARDIAYFGDSKMEMICEAYHLDDAALSERLDDPDFRLLVKTYRKDMDKDVNGMVRARAKLMVDAQLDAMHNIVMNGEKDSDRIRAFTAMAQIADALPKQERSDGAPVGAAANIVFNFGSQSPFRDVQKQMASQAVTIDMESANG